MGYIYSLLSSILFTIYIIPKKLSKQKTHVYTLFMGVGDFVTASVFWLAGFLFFNVNESFFSPWLLLSCLSGVLWFFASLLFLTGVDKIGLSRASQFKNLQGPIGSVLILFVFSEFVQIGVFYILLSIFLIFFSAILFTINEEGSSKVDLNGVLLAVLSAILFGVNAFIKKAVIMQGFVFAQQFWQSVFIIICAVTFVGVKDKSLHCFHNVFKKDNFYAFFAGSFYYFATFSILQAYKHILGSVAFTISQLYAVWLTVFGIFVFKEINFKKHKTRIILGFLSALLGLVVLFFAQG